jgi:hypothetical protein
MREPGNQTYHYRDRQFFGKIESGSGHFIGFLLTGGFQTGNHGEISKIPAVLLVLTGVHSRIVRHCQNDTTFDIQEGGIHEGIGGNIQSDVFHGYQNPSAAERGTQGFLECGLLIAAPVSLMSAVSGRFQ